MSAIPPRSPLVLILAPIFLLSLALVAWSATSQLLVGDLDQDGTLERIHAEWDGDTLVLREESGRLIAVLDDAALAAAFPDLEVLRLAGAADLRLADVDGDGLPDLLAGDVLLLAGRELTGPSGRAIDGFEEKWNTGEVLGNVWDSEVDDLDSDGVLEIICQAYYYADGTVASVYENDADDHFTEVWACPPHYTPSIVALDTGETDEDGQREIIAGEAGTLGRLYLWENTGDDTYEERTLGLQVGCQVREIHTADTDRDGRLEIIAAGGTSSGGSLIICEHNGVAGQNVYTNVFTYDTVSYLFGCMTGDADNDGNLEVLLEVGGWGGFPTYIRRVEYNPGMGTWEHKLFEASTTGSPISSAIADLDGDGENELVVGSGEVIFIYKSYADDTFTPVWTSGFDIPGNVMNLAVGPASEFGYPTLAACSFEGQVDLISYDGAGYVRLLETPLSVGDPLRSVDLGFFDGADPLRDLVLARSGSDLVSLFEELDMSSADWEQDAAGGLLLTAVSNPFRPGGEILFAAPAGAGPLSLRVYDVSGRLLRTLAEGKAPGARHAVIWDGRDAQGRPQASGVYFVRLQAGRDTDSRRLVLLR